MHVILTVNFSPWSSYSGGAQRSTHNLALALSDLGHEVHVIYTKSPWENPSVPSDLPYAMHWSTVWSPNRPPWTTLRPLSAVSVARQVRRLLRDNTWTVVHGNGEESALIPKLKRRYAFGFVLTPRFPAFPRIMNDGRWRRSPAKEFLWLFHAKYMALGKALERADRWCPTSQASARLVRSVYGLSEDNCRVVPNGVGTEFLTTNAGPNAHSGPLVFFGRMTAQKGFGDLVDALLLLGERAPSCVFIGRGPLRKSAQSALRRAGLDRKAIWIDWLDAADLAGRISQCSMAVLPSREESFGNAVAEAMAVGTPVVTARVGSLPELVTDGETGLLVTPRSPREIAAAIVRLRENRSLARTLGENARRRIKERYSWPAVARRFSEIYEEVSSVRSERPQRTKAEKSEPDDLKTQ